MSEKVALWAAHKRAVCAFKTGLRRTMLTSVRNKRPMAMRGRLSVQHLRIVAAAVILCLLLLVALSPGLVYAPVPRVVLFLLSSVFLAALIGAEASSRFRLELPGFLFVTGGASALALGTLVLATNLSKPDRQIVVFEVVDERGEKVNLGVFGALEMQRHPSGLQPTYFVSGNSVVLIFPEQVVEQTILVRTTSTGRAYKGVVSYAKPPAAPLRLTEDLK